MSATCSAAASPRRRPANAARDTNARNRGAATSSSFPTCSVVGIVIAAAERRARGSATPSVGSLGITRSRTAPRRTARTLLTRVLIVPGASPRASIDLTHASTCDRRRLRSGTSANVVAAARSITRRVPEAHTCRADHVP
jgi:hypothetical protein